MRKMVGASMVFAVFALIFTVVAMQVGTVTTIAMFGIALALTAVVVAGVNLFCC